VYQNAVGGVRVNAEAPDGRALANSVLCFTASSSTSNTKLAPRGSLRGIQKPRRLVHMQERLRALVDTEALPCGLQPCRRRIELVPESVRIDLQAFARHRTHLALQWLVVEVLGSRNLNGEVDAIATFFAELEWSLRGLDACTAGATHLLTTMEQHHEAPLDDSDFFARLVLTDPSRQRFAARRAGAGSCVHFVHDVHARKLGLCARTVALLFLRRPIGLGLALRAGALLGTGTACNRS
jgi:hypothetical protein